MPLTWEREYIYQAGETVQGWTLLSPLGLGGQGEVWRATRSGDATDAAVKFIREEDRQSEEFKRFRQEVDTLQRLGPAYPGIIPIRDADVDADPPWMATEIAHPLLQVVDKPPLSLAVRIIRDAAETLAGLASEYGIHHRDIHPRNLFEYRGEWCIGDWGLVFDPTAPHRITQANDRWKRGLAFVPPELIDRPYEAAGEPTDVYSLGKCLYVLAAHLDWTPPGLFTFDASPLGRADVGEPAHLRDDERWSNFLVYLVEATMTQAPARRPTLELLSDELTVWLTSDLGRHPWTRIAFSGPFPETFLRFGDANRRRFLRALELLDETEALLSQNVGELAEHPGWWTVDVAPGLWMTFERAGDRLLMLACETDNPLFLAEAGLPE